MAQPKFKLNEIVLKNGKRYLVLAVGEEAYFLNQLDVKASSPEPKETCWGFEGFEPGAERLASVTEHPWGGFSYPFEREA